MLFDGYWRLFSVLFIIPVHVSWRHTYVKTRSGFTLLPPVSVYLVKWKNTFFFIFMLFSVVAIVFIHFKDLRKKVSSEFLPDKWSHTLGRTNAIRPLEASLPSSASIFWSASKFFLFSYLCKICTIEILHCSSLVE